MSSATLKRSGRPAWQEPAKPVTKAAKGVALAVICLLVLVPFLVVISTSLASPDEVVANGGWVLWPQHPTFDAYRDIFRGGQVTKAIGVSIGVTLVGTLASLVATTLLAYALSRPQLVGGKKILLGILFTFLFPPGMIPAYLVVKQLGLLDNYAALVAPVMINVFNLVIVRGFIQGLPEELFEAARLDGAGEWQVLWRVVLPLSKAVLAVIGLFYAVSYWNAWFHASIYMSDSKFPIQQVLRMYVIQGAQLADPSAADAAAVSAPQTVRMAVVIIAVIPIILVYPFVQRFFVRGVLTGAIKS
ncbi:putative aldouronate transport system permease protein [Hamadaea flava]|uniref:Carbohydrate ABC transporter permease n=1 Tax=Hamadaea flava TaxID=1742688 RepID=A0ABV8LRP5_9ACTN|nr:carbohydrate ABC transporter permease [Hamadaea flava]MCP2321861.1 putative aldouronate transport system permease protein [Hamadaea flava]